MHSSSFDNRKYSLWNEFEVAHNIATNSVPLFEDCEGFTQTISYGKDGRTVIKRSKERECLMRSLGRTLIDEYQTSTVKHDGILYIMMTLEDDSLKPLYIGKAEIFGKQNQNLSANISDLASGNGKFGRWGYNYAYHLGDLSAATCPGHDPQRITTKYLSWRDKLFAITDDLISPKAPIKFWATLWGADSQSVWRDYGTTKLSFEEYLLIGVASDVFPNHLLNREGRTR